MAVVPRLANAHRVLGLSQKKITEKLGVNRSVLFRLEQSEERGTLLSYTAPRPFDRMSRWASMAWRSSRLALVW
jgi:transposase